MGTSQRAHRFLIIAEHDQRLSTVHVCLYLVLCVMAARSVDVYFSISRKEIMKLMKISGLATYHKTIKELHVFGYIDYVPSFHPINGSVVRLNDFQSLIQL